MLKLQNFGKRFLGSGQLTFKSQRWFSAINVGTLNTSGPEESPARVRNTYIGNILKTKSPHLMFFQEFTKLGPVTKKWEKYELKPSYRYIGDSESSMLYDSDVLEFKSLNADSIELLDNNDEIFSRLSIGLFKDIKDGIWFIGASWHGPHKVKKQYKLELLKNLLEIVSKIKDIEKVKYVILSGDFNIPIEKAKEVVPKGFKMFGYESEVREGKDIIDFCITSENFPMTEYLSEEVPEEFLKAFDHGLGTGVANFGTSNTEDTGNNSD